MISDLETIEMAKSFPNFVTSCRVCLTPINYQVSVFDIIEVDGRRVTISSALQETYPFKLQIASKDDCLPRTICFECLDNLKTSYKFRKICELTNQRMLEIISDHETLHTGNIQKSYHNKYNIKECCYIQDLPTTNELLESNSNNVEQIKTEEIDILDEIVETDVKAEIKIEDTNPLHEIAKDVEEQKENGQPLKQEHLIGDNARSKSCSKPLQSCPASNHQEGKHQFDLCVKSHNKYRCDICLSTFPNAYKLNAHKMRHNDYRPNACDTCGKRYPTVILLNEHKRTHTLQKSHKCQVCERKVTSRGNLKKHLLTHSGEKPYSCQYCERSFGRKGNLRVHVRTHTGEKPYSCQYCKKNFRSKENLRVHIRTHTGEKPYTCIVCDKKLAHVSSLRMHVRRHRHHSAVEEAGTAPLL